jgi:transcriptional regulator with XRE-family HTH domain
MTRRPGAVVRTRDGEVAGVRLADLLLAHRQRAGLTQQELARRSGVAVRTVRDIEQGRVRAPRPASLVRLAGALGLSDAQDAALGAAGRGAAEGAAERRLRVDILGTVQLLRDGRPLPRYRRCRAPSSGCWRCGATSSCRVPRSWTC